MKLYTLELSEEELLDVELAIIISIQNHKKEGRYKDNLKNVRQRIKQFQEGADANLSQYC